MATFSELIRSLTSLNLAASGKTADDAVDAIKITPAANAAAANVLTVTNASHGQATTLTIPDVGASTGKVPVANGSLVSGNLVSLSGTSGVVVDSGVVAANVVTSSAGTIATVTVTLNATQVTGAYATPVVLIAAPAAGKAIIIQEATIYTNSTGQTAFATGGAGKIQYDSTINGGGTNACSATIAAGNITAASSQIINLTTSTSAITGITAKGIYFSNATGAFTNGTGSTVVIILTYQVITATV